MRVKTGFTRRHKHQKVLKAAKGFWMTRSKRYKAAHEAVLEAAHEAVVEAVPKAVSKVVHETVVEAGMKEVVVELGHDFSQDTARSPSRLL
jgi:uncharacterized membrane protein